MKKQNLTAVLVRPRHQEAKVRVLPTPVGLHDKDLAYSLHMAEVVITAEERQPHTALVSPPRLVSLLSS